MIHGNLNFNGNACISGCEVWGFSPIEQIEVIYRKFIKTLLKINLYSPNVMVYDETGTFPVINVITAKDDKFLCQNLE